MILINNKKFIWSMYVSDQMITETNFRLQDFEITVYKCRIEIRINI